MPRSDATPIGSTSSYAAAPPRGRLTVIQGCMFSGKTTELLRRLDCSPPGETAAFKHVADNRYRDDAIVSHGGKAHPAVGLDDAASIPGRVRDRTKLVAIDEGHFFGPSLAECSRALTGRGIDVAIALLDLDSWGRPFPVAAELAAMADEPILKHAVCARCGGIGERTQRLTPIIDGNMVGGAESYQPRCRACWTPPPA